MKKKQNRDQRIILILLSLIFILSLIPLYYIGLYAHPNADDYSYGVHTKVVWETTHSLPDVLETASAKTIDKYYRWQGNFSAIFLMYLQPGIFGEPYYFIAPFLLLTTFILFSFFFYYIVFRKVVKTTASLSFLASLIILFFALQFTHVPSDSFYWYNGAIYYTFFYSLSLLLYGMLILLYHCKHVPVKVLWMLPSIALSFLIGGSNYATALLNAILLLLTVLYFVFKKNQHFFYYLPVFASGTIALFISMSGPGNALRQSTIGSPHSPILSILLSLVYGGYSIANATTVPVFLFWLLLVPIFGAMLDKTHHRFQHPFLMFMISFCIYSVQITPVIYAQGIRIPYRIRNIVCFSYYIFVAFNLFYFLGYLKQKKEFPNLTKPLPLRFYYVGLLFAILVSCLGSIEVNESPSGNVEISNLIFTASAVYSLVIDEAKGFDQEANDRIAYLETTSNRDVLLNAFTYKPYVLYHSDISYDPSFWKNQHLARYYKKRTVRLR